MFPLYSCKVRLNDSVLNEVRKSDVTAPEIMILRAVHGDGAVLDINETGKAKRTHAQERQRIYSVYANAETNNSETVAKKMTLIRNLFGHDSLDLPTKLPSAIERVDLDEGNAELMA